MASGISLGKVWNIPIRLHLSWFVIFILVSWSLATGYFPVEYPEMSTQIHWAQGIITSALFAASVLLHELGHAFVAIRREVPVKSVTLYIFGGIAQIEKEPKTAGAEFLIAIAGPGTSLLLGLVFLGIWFFLQQFPILAAPGLWLARINLTLALFNMIPGFPLDGGRVLRSIVWRITNNLHKATRFASIAGQVIAFGFISLGIYVLFTGNFYNGLWLAFIGWFLQNAAASSLAQSTMTQSLKGIKVSQVMLSNIPRIPWQTKLDELINNHVLNSGNKIFLVTDTSGQYLRGMLTVNNVTRIPQYKWPGTTVDEIMIPRKDFIAVSRQDELLEALKKMDDANVAQVPVIEEDAVIGILSREQIVHFIRLRSEIGM